MQRPGVRRLFSISLRRDRWERDVEDEILTHLANRAERLMEQGMSAAEAKNEAMRRFGSLEEGRTRLLEAASHREDYMRRKEHSPSCDRISPSPRAPSHTTTDGPPSRSLRSPLALARRRQCGARQRRFCCIRCPIPAPIGS